MSTSHRHETDFRDALISSNLLEEAIEWIAKNLSPEDVFGEDKLDRWAGDNGYVIPED